MARTSFSGMTTTFETGIKRFQKIQRKFKKTIEKGVTRQIKIISPNTGSEEIKEMIKNPAAVEALLQEKMYGTAHFSVVTAVEDIKEKFDDILILQQVSSS